MSDDSKNTGSSNGAGGGGSGGSGSGSGSESPKKPQISKVVLRESEHPPSKRG